MAIHFTTQVEAGVLIVRATGFDESAAEVEAYGFSVIAACKEHGVTRALCDERDLEYRLGTLDTYAAAVALSEMVPKVARVAIVCSPLFLSDAQFFETVAVNRGVQVRAFAGLVEARAWIGLRG